MSAHRYAVDVFHQMTDMKPFAGYCEECKQPCKAHVVDFGIGPYEYWGRKGYDTNKQVASKCCDAPILDDEPVQPDETDE